jgi:hypothetical protein
MADKKVSELTAITSISGDDLLLVVNDPNGTPASNKITVTNLFSEVPVETEFSKNTTFSSNTVTVSANLFYQGTELQSMIDQKISVTNSAIATSALWGGITGTNTAIRTLVSDRMQVANTVTLVNDRMQVANTTLLVNDRLQVANAAATYVANSYLNLVLDNIATLAQANNIIADNSVNTAIIRVSSANGIQGTVRTAPGSNNATTEGLSVGTIFFSNNHLYIATDATTIKRVSLEVFS